MNGYLTSLEERIEIKLNIEVNFENLIILWIFENEIKSLIRRDSIFMITHSIGSSAERFQERDRTRRNERLKNNDELTDYSPKWNHQTKTSSLILLEYSDIHITSKKYSWNEQWIYELMIVKMTPKKIEVYDFEFSIKTVPFEESPYIIRERVKLQVFLRRRVVSRSVSRTI